MTTETTAGSAAETASGAAAATSTAAPSAPTSTTTAAAIAPAVASVSPAPAAAAPAFTTLRQWATEQSARDKRVALLHGFVHEETQARRFKDTETNYASRYVAFANKPL